MDREDIINRLNPIVDTPGICGFEVYLVTRDEPRLKKMKISRDGLHKNLKSDIGNVIFNRFMSEDAIFAKAEEVADNQKKFYVIEQSEVFRPLDVTNWENEDFNENHLSDFMGFLFEFSYDEQKIWCYQNRRSTTITNRKKTSRLARITKTDSDVFFEEQTETVVSFAHAIDILLIDGILITDDIRLLERSFSFNSFIQKRALEAAESVAATEFFSGMDKLNEYLVSDVKGHKPYKKKIMKALDSPVLRMNSSDLFSKIFSLPRWKGKFKAPIDGRIPIETNKEVESMIDLLIERFTVSEVTGQEYDTEVKKKAESV